MKNLIKENIFDLLNRGAEFEAASWLAEQLAFLL